MLKCLAGLLAAPLLALPALADEVWTTDMGEVIYEADLENGDAVLSYPLDETGAVRGHAVIHGLAGEYEGRGAYDGVWIEPDGPGEACPVAIADPRTGEPFANWGRVKLVFVDPDFPGSFVAMRGNCFGEPGEFVVGRPVVGGGAE